MMFWAVFAILASIAIGEKIGDQEFFWKVTQEQSVTLQPFSCQNFEFVFPAKSAGRLSFSDSNFPPECYPEATLWMTSELYHNGYCLDLDYKNDKCLSPDSAGLLFKEEMCNNWDLLTLTYYQPDMNMTTDFSCMKKHKYFFAMRSSCYWPISLKMKVETRNLTYDEDVVCTVLGGILGIKAIHFVGIVALLIGIVVIGIVVLCCCCSFPCCPLFKQRYRYQLLISGQTTGYVPIPGGQNSAPVIGSPVSNGTPVSYHENNAGQLFAVENSKTGNSKQGGFRPLLSDYQI